MRVSIPLGRWEARIIPTSNSLPWTIQAVSPGGAKVRFITASVVFPQPVVPTINIRCVLMGVNCLSVSAAFDFSPCVGSLGTLHLLQLSHYLLHQCQALPDILVSKGR